MQPMVQYFGGALASATGAGAALQRCLARLWSRVGRQRIAPSFDGASATVSAAVAVLRGHLDRVRPLVGHGAHWIVDCLNGALATVSGVAMALPGWLGHAGRSAFRSARVLPPFAVAAAPPRLAHGREWEIVVDLLRRDLARAHAIAAIQAHAALKIDAAEYALNRIVADCAAVLTTPLMPLRPPARRVHRPELRMRRPLAAWPSS
jgi:hypothetical protein